MAVLKIIGNSDAIKQTTTKRWTYNEGEVLEESYKGVYSAIANLYEAYKVVAGFNPDYDQLQLSYSRGTGQLTVSSGADGEPQYELIGQMISNPIWSHPYFVNSLTPEQICVVRADFERNTKKTFTGKQLELWNMMAVGTEEYQIPAYVLRENKVVTKRSTATADHTGVGRVVTLPDVSAINTLIDIANVPTGEWLLQVPQVRPMGKRKWIIQREWWWMEKWSRILYGGTG